MIDHILRKPKKVLLAPAAKSLQGLSPNLVSFASFAIGVLAVFSLLKGFCYLGLLLWLLNRVLDGLDGELARAHSKQTDWGGYLDILFDFIIYALIPIALVYAKPSSSRYLFLAVLLASFYVNAGSWMYISALSEKRAKGAQYNNEQTSISMPRGLIEGAETIIFYCLFMIFSNYLVPLFLSMTLLLWLTIAQRSVWAYGYLKELNGKRQ